MEVLLVANDQLIQVIALKNVSTGAYVNNGVGTATLKDSGGVNVTGAINLALSYKAATNGEYEALMASTVVLVAGSEYTLHVDFTSPAVFHAEVPCVARVRRN